MKIAESAVNLPKIEEEREEVRLNGKALLQPFEPLQQGNSERVCRTATLTITKAGRTGRKTLSHLTPAVDFTASFKRLKEAIIAFNEKLKAEQPKKFRSQALAKKAAGEPEEE